MFSWRQWRKSSVDKTEDKQAHGAWSLWWSWANQGGTPFSMGAGRWVLNAQSRFGQDSALPVMSCKVLIVGNEEVKGVEAFYFCIFLFSSFIWLWCFSVVAHRIFRCEMWTLNCGLRTLSSFFAGDMGSRITADGDCGHEIKRCLLLGRKVMTNLDSTLKSRDITLPTRSV